MIYRLNLVEVKELGKCENFAPFLKPEEKTPKFVSSEFGFGLEIKLVACLK